MKRRLLPGEKPPLCKHCGEQLPIVFSKQPRRVCDECLRLAHNKRGSQAKRRMYENNPLKMKLSSIRHSARKRGLKFDLTEDDLIVPEFCPVLGIPLMFGGPKDNWPTADRVYNHLGYVTGNVRIISWKANRIKSTMSFEEAKAVVRYIQMHKYLK